ncbi:MAG TPA: hypothetical protein VGJ84_23955, partial [Polyangiaceae bacterium]
RPPQVGDIVVLHTAGPPRVPAAPAPAAPPAPGARPSPAPSRPAAPEVKPAPPAETRSAVAPAPPAGAATEGGAQAPVDAQAGEVMALFESLKGTDLYTRARAYEQYAQKHPATRLARVLVEEAMQIRRLLLAVSTGQPTAPVEGLRARSFSAPNAIVEGQVPSLGVEVLGPAKGAILFVRKSGDLAYVSRPMVAAGTGYFRSDISLEQARAPGVEYFIEAVGPDGRGQAVVGSDAEPIKLEVQRQPTPRAEHYEVSVTMLTDYADWNRLKGNDWAWQTEGSMGVRITDVGLRAVRSGFGVYRGEGGSLDELDKLGVSRRVGLTYGYLEAEFGVSSFTGLIARGIIGLQESGVTGGAQGFIRLGNDKSTNLLLGGEVLGGVGLRGITELDLNIFERVPIVLRTEVTNQPAGEPKSSVTPVGQSQEQAEVGARAIAQIGYRIVPTFVVAVRGSYEGRTIRHAGPGGGAAVSYQW